LWRFSRHPNYFGEVAMWSGLAAVTSFASSSASPSKWFAWLSPAFTAFLLLKVSVAKKINEWNARFNYNTSTRAYFIDNLACCLVRLILIFEIKKWAVN
jgi:steroid 5-alpha reductase family enzyme